MNPVESTARAAHGNFIYRQTWLARTTDQKWRWAIVGGWTLISLVTRAILFCFLAFWALRFLDAFARTGFALQPSDLPVATLALFFILFIGYLESTLGSRFIGAASSFYSIAADMVRIGSTKRVARLAYLFCGSLAVGFAYVSWSLRDLREKKLTSSELDVLGSILSKAKFWKQAKDVYHEIGMLYASRLQNKQDHVQLSVSYALACKWMLSDPTAESSTRALRLVSIQNVLDDYKGALPPEVTLRLYEAFDTQEKMRIEERKIALSLN